MQCYVKCFQRRSCPKQDKNNKVLVQNRYTQIQLTVLNTKNWFGKLSIKRFVKSKTTARKAYAYRMVLSFKTSVTYKKNILNFIPDSCVRYEAVSVGHDSEIV